MGTRHTDIEPLAGAGARQQLALTLSGVLRCFYFHRLRDNCGCQECRVPQSGYSFSVLQGRLV